MPTKRLPPNCSATHPPADAMSCGRVIATYASAIGAMNTPALPTTLIASCAPSAAMRIVLFPAAPSAASRIVFFSVSHTQNSLPKRLCSRATSWAHLETDSARHLEILCRFVLPAASAPRDGMPVACRGQCALHRLLGISAIRLRGGLGIAQHWHGNPP